MSETDALDKSDRPTTVSSLAKDLQTLGLPHDRALLVHSSLSALGWVCGGAQAVIEALIQSVGNDGTLVLPTHSGGLSDPANWNKPPVRRDWWEPIRSSMPAFNRNLTPTRGVGVIPELFRSQPEVERGNHPACSFAARGPLASQILAEQQLEDPFGESSPLSALYELDASILLLGVGYDSCTMLHLAERRAEGDRARKVRGGAPIIENGVRCWKVYAEPEVSSEDFAEAGQAFESAVKETCIGPAGRGTARLIPVRALVDFAVPWFRENR